MKKPTFPESDEALLRELGVIRESLLNKSDEALLRELGAIRESLLNIVMNATNLTTRLDNITAELKARKNR